MKLIAISDTHGRHGEISPSLYTLLDQYSDIQGIVHAGDGSNTRDPVRNESELRDFLEWYSTLPIDYKIFTGGNHDTSLEAGLVRPADYPDITFLKHEETTLEGIKIFGSPYTPEFHNWAFNVPRDKIGRYWKSIPADVDLLITHGPPKYILDSTYSRHVGDLSLFKKFKNEEIAPKVHVFGHVHNERGNINNGKFQLSTLPTTFINASMVDLTHSPVNNPVVFEM